MGQQAGDRGTLRVQMAGGRKAQRLAVEVEGPPGQGLDGDTGAFDRGGGELLVRAQAGGGGAGEAVPGGGEGLLDL